MTSDSDLNAGEELLVLFSKDDPVYKPGDTVSGKVVFSNQNRREKVRRVYIKVRGVAEVYVQVQKHENGSSRTETHWSTDRFFKLEHTLKDVEKENKSVVEPGTYEYPFSFVLPPAPKCPPSFEFAEWGDSGYVYYYVEAVLDERKSIFQKLKPDVKNWFKSSKKKGKYGYFIVDAQDLDPKNSGLEPVQVTKKGSSGGVMGLGGKPVYCTAALESPALQFGVTAPLRISVKNESNGTVNKIKIRLVHRVRLHAGWDKKWYDWSIAKADYQTPVDPKSSLQDHVLQLRVPQRVPFTRPLTAGDEGGLEGKGRLRPVRWGAAKKVLNTRPYEFAWYGTEHASASFEASEQKWLHKPQIKSYYVLKIEFDVSNGKDPEIVIPVTIHPGLAPELVLDYDGTVDEEEENPQILRYSDDSLDKKDKKKKDGKGE